MAQLAKYVHVAGDVYSPGDEPPDEVARLIRNPKAWEGGEVPDLDAVDPDEGDGDEPPDEVARLIRNPKAWEGGEVPDLDAVDPDEGDGDEGQGDGDPPERPAESATKDAWIEYVLAIADLDESTVRAMTKPALIAKAEEAEQTE